MSNFKVLILSTVEEGEVNESAFRMNFRPDTIVKVTNNDEFLEMKYVSKFDAVVLHATVSADELEMQQDFMEHYLKAPITCLCVSEEHADDFALPEELAGLIKKTVKPCPAFSGADLVANWSPIFADLKAMWENTNSSELKKVFDEFDKDASGAIDKAELKAMMEKLGTNLDDEQVENALKDLDLNGDGVIDFDEMKRWYFSGMQGYSEASRSLRQMRSQIGSMTSGLADPAIVELVKANNDKMVKQRLYVGFNNPAEETAGTDLSVRFNLFGKEYEKYSAACDAFANDQFAGKRRAYFSFEMNGSQETLDALKSAMDGFLDEVFVMAPMDPKPKISVEFPAGKILIQGVSPSETASFTDLKNAPEVPPAVIAALANQDQFFEAHVRLATSPGKLLDDEKLVECIKEGFSAKVEIQYLKCIKKVIEKMPKAKQVMDMGGFGLKVGVNMDMNLTYDDIEELQENELASKFIEVNLSSLFEQFGIDKAELVDYKTEEPEASEEMPPQAKLMQRGLKIANALSNVLKGTTDKSEILMNVFMEGMGHLQFKLVANGFGPAANIGFNAATKQMREMFVQVLSQE